MSKNSKPTKPSAPEVAPKKAEIPAEVLSGTGSLPKAPFFAVGCVFALALFSLAVTVILLPKWQDKQAEQQALADKTYQFTQAAVILPNARARAEHRRLTGRDKNNIKTPAQNAAEISSKNASEIDHKNAPIQYEEQIIDLNTLKTPPLGQNISRTTPFTQQTPNIIPTHTHKTPKWRTNAHPIIVPENHAKIAIVIDDMGVADAHSQAVIDRLPAAVTLAFLPYGEATKYQAKQAFNKGHDIMIHLPMQPHRKTANPGPNALYADDTTAQLKRKINLNFQPLKSISVGVNNHMGSKMTEHLQGMRTVLEAVAAEKMFFLDSVTTHNSSVLAASTGLNLPVLQRHVFLDHEVTPEFINGALARAERYAKKHGTAIVIGHPYPATTSAIENWMKTLEDKQISLIPISNLLQ